MLNWSAEQKTLVDNLIAQEVERARLSHRIIPEMGVADDARSVSADRYEEKGEKNSVDDVSTIPLVELSATVNLTKLQSEDADLSAALMLVRRAANRLARAHDAVCLVGQPGPDRLPDTAPGQVVAAGGFKNGGAASTPAEVEISSPANGSFGEALVAQIADALVRLESAGYIGSYVLILGQSLFADANTPSAGSLVLPKDRLDALLAGGPIHRSSVLASDQGILLSMGGEPMDRAIAVSPRFEFLRIGENDVRQCRVFERFAFRLKEKGSVVRLVRKSE